MTSDLTLKKALETNRLSDFIAQEEARGAGVVNQAELMKAIETTIKQPRLEDQTSRSASRGGLAEK